MKAGAQIGRSAQGSDLPPLPLPSQELGWMPSVSLLDDPQRDRWNGD